MDILATLNAIHFTLLGLYMLLITASASLYFMSRKEGGTLKYKELSDRTKSWWLMVTIFSAAILSSPTISVLFFALVSFLALKEYVSLIPIRLEDRRIILWAYLAIPIQYLFVYLKWYGLFIVFIPVWVYFLMPFRLALTGKTQGFLRSITAVSYGLMITVFAVSHGAMLISFEEGGGLPAGGAGLLLYMAILNQLNDVAQYVWGKALGKNKIIPAISPNKTWEGFIGGLITTALLSILIAPYLTPMGFIFSLLAGLLIGASGFIGDVSISAIKRDLKIKDTGSLIPGHGGILDRIDSMSLTAPLFFHFFRYFFNKGLLWM